MIQCEGQLSIFDLIEQPAQTKLDKVGIGGTFPVFKIWTAHNDT